MRIWLNLLEFCHFKYAKKCAERLAEGDLRAPGNGGDDLHVGPENLCLSLIEVGHDPRPDVRTALYEPEARSKCEEKNDDEDQLDVHHVFDFVACDA